MERSHLRSEQGYASLALLLLAACAVPPAPPPPQAPSPPPWVLRGPRSLVDSRIIFLGSGEDRAGANARLKAIAMGLQDLANECSFIPRGSEVSPERYDETVGIIFRSFATVSVTPQQCEAARNASNAADVRRLADFELAGKLGQYQRSYDAPEPEEARPPADAPITDTAGLFLVRQQLALAREGEILAPPAGAAVEEPAQAGAAERRVAEFERAHGELFTSSAAFSYNRPRWIDHQAAAVRDPIDERNRIREKYSRPPPLVLPTDTRPQRPQRHPTAPALQ